MQPAQAGAKLQVGDRVLTCWTGKGAWKVWRSLPFARHSTLPTLVAASGLAQGGGGGDG